MDQQQQKNTQKPHKVKKMYQLVNFKMSEGELEDIKTEQLKKYPDCLFKLFNSREKQEKKNLHCLLFNPSVNSSNWMKLIEEKYSTLTPQLVIRITGDVETLKTFCKDFPQELKKNADIAAAAAAAAAAVNFDDDDDDEDGDDDDGDVGGTDPKPTKPEEELPKL